MWVSVQRKLCCRHTYLYVLWVIAARFGLAKVIFICYNLQNRCFSMFPCIDSGINDTLRTWWRLILTPFCVFCRFSCSFGFVSHFVLIMTVCRLIYNKWMSELLMSNNYIIRKPLKIPPLFAIQCAVRHVVSKFSYYFREMQCTIATHYSVKVSEF